MLSDKQELLTGRRSPAELLFEQTETLSQLLFLQQQQKALLEQIAENSRSAAQWSEFLGKTMLQTDTPQLQRLPVKVVDFDIPFATLVFLIIKFILAYFSAILVLSVVVATIAFTLVMFFRMIAILAIL